MLPTSVLQWIVNGYLLALSSLILLGGSLGDCSRVKAEAMRSRREAHRSTIRAS